MFKHVKFKSTTTSLQKKEKQKNQISTTLSKFSNARREAINSQYSLHISETETSQIPSKLSSNFNLTHTIQCIPKSTKNNLFQNKQLPLNKNQKNNFIKHSPYLTENVEKNKYNKQFINQNNNNNKQNLLFANLFNVKISHKPFGIIHSYATMTSNGKRDYNEDRVSIVYNIPKPPNFKESKENLWPNCSFFGLYDGHGGNGTCDFLRDNLHKFIINDKNFPINPQRAIANGYIHAEKIFLKNFGLKGDFSGSCAIIILIVENRVFIANVGDSRAILSAKNGQKFYVLSKDHRPGEESEYKRILEAGGKIYKTEYEYEKNNNNKNISLMGPLRVLPGKLSVSRTIGDIEAKNPKYGGNPNVIISMPEIKYFDNNNKNDFILIGCDGIFEKLKNKEIIEKIWKEINKNNFPDIHHLSGFCVESLISECLKKDSNDNLTAIMLSLKDYSSLKNINDFAKTENNAVNKVKKISLPNKVKRSPLKQPLSILLTKLIHNNSSNIKKVVNLKGTEKNKK